jgi:hypothetical protein
MLAEPLEDFARRHVRPRVGQGFVDTLPQPVAERRFLTIQGAHRSAYYLARRRIGAGLDPRRDALLKVAQGTTKADDRRSIDKSAVTWFSLQSSLSAS